MNIAKFEIIDVVEYDGTTTVILESYEPKVRANLTMIWEYTNLNHIECGDKIGDIFEIGWERVMV